MVETLRGLETRQVHTTPQDHSRATLAPILKKEDGRMDFSRSAAELVNRIRGFRPWPGAFTTFRIKTLQVHMARAQQLPALKPAELGTEKDHLFVGCGGNTTLELIEVQMEGKRRRSATEFIHGYHPKVGERLD